MTMDYYDRQRAKVAIMEELQRRGWTIYGYTPDRSDPMTDYFAPASWEGVAEKDGVVVCVDVGEYQVTHFSGGRTLTRSVPAETCPHCGGTGEEPDGWTYQQALQNPREFNFTHCRRISPDLVPGLPDVVSPLHFTESGREKCHVCGGAGHGFRLETYIEPWPVFHANPPRCAWHVERDGKILAKGTGLSACVPRSYEPEKSTAERAVKKIVTKMEEAAFNTGNAPKQAEPGTDHATFWINGTWSWLKFGSKPAQEIIDALKADGWRFSGKRQAWYHTAGHEPPACVDYTEQTA